MRSKKTKTRIIIILATTVPATALLIFFLLIFFFNNPENTWPGIEKTWPLNYDYSEKHICYSYPIKKDEFFLYASEISTFRNYSSYGDSVFSVYFPIKDIYFLADVIIKEDSGNVMLKLKRIDKIIYNSCFYKDTSLFGCFTKQLCLAGFQNQFIPGIEDALWFRLKVDTLYLEGLELIHNEDYEKAFAVFDYIDSVLSKEHGNLQYIKYSALNRMANIKIQQELYQEAIELLQRAIDIEPWEISYEECKNYESRRDSLPETARRYWIRKNPVDEIKSQYRYNTINVEHLLIHLNFARAYIQSKQFEKAKEEIEIAKYMYPEIVNADKVKSLYMNN
jgi:tetratricopeptide (TPR) repeat protein